MVAADGFEIDATEVTRDQYREFLATNPSIDPEGECSWNERYYAECAWDDEERGDYPATCLDWCDAKGYCEWAGKRLCAGDFYEPENDEWYRACAGQDQLSYPYGDTFSLFACNGFEAGLQHSAPVGQFPGCVGAYGHLFDMSGNVLEWTAACQAGFGPESICRLRGGSYANDGEVLTCDYDYGEDSFRGMANRLIGFRCCKGDTP